MKKTLLIVIFFVAGIFYIQAQNLYSTTPNGGDNGAGAIIKFMPASNTLTVVKSFDGLAGSMPTGNLVRATDHKLYGMTQQGGSNNVGTIFSFDPLTGTYKKLFDFNNTDGTGPLGGLIQATDGKLYGMTHGGGSSNRGVIFSFDLLSGIYTKEMDFNNSDGSYPSGNLMQASDGKLYGTTAFGGINAAGVIFSFDPFSSAYTKLLDFSGSASYPVGGLIQAKDGKLYGMTGPIGGVNGTIFSFDPVSFNFNLLKSLSFSNEGINPQGSLIQASNGKFYGMASTGGSGDFGVIFSFDLSSIISPYSVLKNFDSTNGSSPLGTLLLASNGEMYGMTSKGGSKDAGVIFSFDPSSSTYTKLVDYNGVNGAAPGLGSAFIEGHDCITDTVYYRDADGDGFGNQVDSVLACSPPAGYAANNTDCDDTNPFVHPGATEVCNGIDDDCNGQIDDGLVFITYYTDADGDGYGTGPGQSLCQSPGPGYATQNGDCDDTNGAIHPGAIEICNGIDDNCDGKIDENCNNVPGITLYGTTFRGGNTGGGTINKFSPSAYNLTIARSFGNVNSINGSKPKGDLLLASDGKLYGMTSDGGNSHFGVIFSFDPSTSTYSKLKDFDSTNGRNPGSSFIQASDGKLYGMAQFGGNKDSGVIFSFDPASHTFTKLYDFDGSGGANPNGSLLRASNGKLYGMTKLGGSAGRGVLFSFDLSLSTYTKLHDFDGPNGANPTGSLMQASDGKLYGLTSHGGSPFDDCGGCGNWGDGGVIFSYDLSTGTFVNLMDLNLNQGEYPYGSLVQAKDGKLYGMTELGGEIDNKGDFGWGTIFSFDPSSSVYALRHTFDPVDGSYPTGNLIQASDGKLYGMVSSGGFNGDTEAPGIIFSFDPSSSAFKTLKALDTTSGANPSGSLLQAPDGKLYGMTPAGGLGNFGVIFSMDPSTSTYTKLKDFVSSNEGGRSVSASLMQGRDKKLYGMTYEGGSNGAGVIFSFDPSSSTYITLQDFNGTNGRNPLGSLIQATDGKLYGMTNKGGNNNVGVIFSFDLATSIYTKLIDFDGTNGSSPYGSLVQATDGKLYGMTNAGGSYGRGVLFSFDPSSSTYKRLVDFNGTTGGDPMGSLIQSKDGKLYGMTSRAGVVNGGANLNAGVIFSYDLSSATYTDLKDFDNVNNRNPQGSLMQAKDGKLYGMTNAGGSSDLGTIFSFDPSSLVFTGLKDFDKANGAHPDGNLMQASDGKLYGMTYEGGSSNLGVIFSFDPSTSTYAKLIDYTGANGANPYFGSVFIELNECVAKTFFRDADGDGYGNADSTVKACTQPAGYVTDSTDCDDTKVSVHPGATEICGNGIDDNCDGQIDEHCNGTPVITINNITVNESQGIATLTVTLSHSTTKPVWVLYFTKDGTAKSWGRNRDYQAEIGLLVIHPGSVTGTISIKIIKDNIAEPKEYFDVVLLTSLNGTITDRAGRIFITDETEPVASISKFNRRVDALSNDLSIKILSNPSSSHFNVTVESNKTGKIDMKVMNAQGKLLEIRSNVSPGKTFQIGGNYRPGSYFIQAVQGGQRKTVTIIKLPE